MIVIDYQDRRPLYEQIVEKYKLLIARGVLESDSQMPSVRALATQLAINPNTIQRAYTELERQGYIYPVKGRGNFISPAAQIVLKRKEEYTNQLEEKMKEGRDLGIEKEEIRKIADRIWREST